MRCSIARRNNSRKARSTPMTPARPAATTAIRTNTRATSTRPRRPSIARTSSTRCSRRSARRSKLWWDLVSPDGYGYNWGRSLGVVSYLDTLEIVAFLAAHPDLRPAPLADLTSEYRLAWIWLRDNYDPNRHMLQVFAPGRGNYAYITKEREWQQNVGFFGKALMAEDTLMRVLAAEKVTSFPAQPASAGRGAVRVLPPRRSARRRVAGAPGTAALRAADHERHQARRRRLSAGAARTSRIHGARRTDRSCRRVVLRAVGRPRAGRHRRRGRHQAGRGRTIARGHLAPLRPRRRQDRQFDRAGIHRLDHLADRRRDTDAHGNPDRDAATSRSGACRCCCRRRPPRYTNRSVRRIRLSGPDGVLEATTSGNLQMRSTIRTVGDEPLGRGPRVPIPTHVTYEAERDSTARRPTANLGAEPHGVGADREEACRSINR